MKEVSQQGATAAAARMLVVAAALAGFVFPLSSSAAEDGEHPEKVASALGQLRTACKAPKVRLVMDWAALKAAASDNENFLFNEEVAATQTAQLLSALADGCARGMSVVDRVVREKHGKLGTKFSRPTRPVPLGRLASLEKIEIGVSKNSAAFVAWSDANWGTPPRAVYEQMLKGRYDQDVLEEDLSVLGRYAKLPPQISFQGKTAFFGIGPAFELLDTWFARFLDIALGQAK